MKIRFKKASESQLYEIEGSNLTIIKVAIIINCGTENAFHIFQKQLDNNILLYLPLESDRDNLVNRSFKKYKAEYGKEISECIKSIKPI